MRKFFHIIFVFILGISVIGGICSQSHNFVDTAHAHTSSIDSEHIDREDFSEQEAIKKPHCCGESRSDALSSSTSVTKNENTNPFKFTPYLSCNTVHSFSFTPNNFNRQNWPSISAQFQPDSLSLGTIVKRE